MARLPLRTTGPVHCWKADPAFLLALKNEGVIYDSLLLFAIVKTKIDEGTDHAHYCMAINCIDGIKDPPDVHFSFCYFIYCIREENALCSVA